MLYYQMMSSEMDELSKIRCNTKTRSPYSCFIEKAQMTQYGLYFNPLSMLHRSKQTTQSIIILLTGLTLISPF